MAERIRLAARSAFEGLLEPVGSGRGVIVSPRDDLQVATVIARDPRAFSRRLEEAFGLAAPAGPKRAAAAGLALLGVGPRTWLAISESGEAGLAQTLAGRLGEAAAVTDQSDGYAVLRLQGPKVRAAFEKGVGVDLHPRAFGPGDVAATTCSHIGVVLWQLDDAPTYEIAMFRSFAASFCRWLSNSAAEFGLELSQRPSTQK